MVGQSENGWQLSDKETNFDHRDFVTMYKDVDAILKDNPPASFFEEILEIFLIQK